jgi:betaine lipid synthase
MGKWLLQANIITRVSAFFVTNPIVLWFCAGVCKGQLNLIRKEDNIYK